MACCVVSCVYLRVWRCCGRRFGTGNCWVSGPVRAVGTSSGSTGRLTQTFRLMLQMHHVRYTSGQSPSTEKDGVPGGGYLFCCWSVVDVLKETPCSSGRHSDKRGTKLRLWWKHSPAAQLSALFTKGMRPLLTAQRCRRPEEELLLSGDAPLGGDTHQSLFTTGNQHFPHPWASFHLWFNRQGNARMNGRDYSLDGHSEPCVCLLYLFNRPYLHWATSCLWRSSRMTSCFGGWLQQTAKLEFWHGEHIIRYERTDGSSLWQRALPYCMLGTQTAHTHDNFLTLTFTLRSSDRSQISAANAMWCLCPIQSHTSTLFSKMASNAPSSVSSTAQLNTSQVWF